MSFWGKAKYIIARAMNRRPSAVIDSMINHKAAIGNGAQIVRCNIGKYSYIYGSNLAETDVGVFCSIAAGSSIGGGSHPTDWASTSPVFYRGKNVLHKNFSQNLYNEFQRTVIGHDVWIGAKCLIKGGVTIGTGAIVGMGSVVTHDVPPYEIWAGNPARFIRKRFDDETIERLLASKWWELDDKELAKCGDLFNNTSALLAYLEGKEL